MPSGWIPWAAGHASRCGPSAPHSERWILQSNYDVATALDVLRGLDVGAATTNGASTTPTPADDEGLLLLRAMLPEVSADVLCEMYEQLARR